MSSNSSSIGVEHSPLDHSIGLGEVLRSALASLWRRKLLVGAIVVSAVGVGIMAMFVTPPSYTPTAFVRGGFVVSNAVAVDENSKSSPYVGLDLTRMIETQSRLLLSEELARRVVQQVGLVQLRPELSERHWLPAMVHESSADQTNRETPTDAALMLLSRLSVTSDPLRTYTIKVSYTGSDPTLAVVVTNAFVAEFLRSSQMQMLFQQRSSAEAALFKELDQFGDKHPRVMQAKVRLGHVDELIRKQLSEAPEVLLQAAGENVTKASVTNVTLSPNPRLVISLLALAGLVVGIAVPLWLERNRWAETFSHYIRPFA